MVPSYQNDAVRGSGTKNSIGSLHCHSQIGGVLLCTKGKDLYWLDPLRHEAGWYPVRQFAKVSICPRDRQLCCPQSKSDPAFQDLQILLQVLRKIAAAIGLLHRVCP